MKAVFKTENRFLVFIFTKKCNYDIVIILMEGSYG